MLRFSPLGNLSDWSALLRLDKPIGYWLLMLPTLWGLLAASGGNPDLKHFIIFVGGVFLMRSAGCVINDFADRDFDPHVERTKTRPIAAGHIGAGIALTGFIGMLLIALLLVLQTSWFVVQLSVIGALLAAIYPFVKRFTHFPQAWLGMSFGWGAVMAWAAVHGTITDSPLPWLLFIANVFWSICYDTAYALGDKPDDLKIGVKSTAIWLGDKAVPVIVALGIIVLILLAIVANALHPVVWLGWLAAALWQVKISLTLLKAGETGGFTFFLQSHWTGLAFCTGLLAQAFI